MDIYLDDLDPADTVRLEQRRGVLGGSLTEGNNSNLFGAVLIAIPTAMVLEWLKPPLDAILFLVTASVGAGAGLGNIWKRSARRKQRATPLSTLEVEMLRKGETDSLRLEYLGLLLALVSLQPTQEASVPQSIRAAVRDCAFGIAALPGHPPGDLLINAKTLNAEAARLSAEASSELDPVVSASLHRQSEARRQRADAIQRSSILMRRNETLRREMAEQVKSLKTLCGAAALGEGNSSYDMTRLVENIRHVACEAKSLAGARQELAAALPQPEPAAAALTNAN